MSIIGSGTQASWYARIKASIVYVALAAALGLVVVLTFQIRSQRAELRRFRYKTFHPYVGMWVPTVRTATVQGDSITIGATADGRRQVLIVFATACGYCKLTLPAWKRLSTALLADRTHPADVLWLSLSSVDSTRAYMREQSLDFPVVKLPQVKLERVFRVNAVPVTVVLDDKGQVVYSRASVLNTDAAIDSVLTAARSRTPTAPGRPTDL
ncbi:MAG: TlpA disulfide reductase family protein [Gemmatimonadaceae bacterium]